MGSKRSPPAIAGLAIRGALKHKTAQIPREQRRQLVKAVSTVTKQIARKHGPRAVVAVPGLVRAAHKLVLRKRLPVGQLSPVVKRAARLALRSPRALRKFATSGGRLRSGRTGYRFGGGVGRALHGTGGYAPTSGYGPGSGYGTGSGYGGGYGQGGGRSPTLGLYRGGGLSHGGSPYRQEGGASAARCPNCRRRTYRIRGPVTITIQTL